MKTLKLIGNTLTYGALVGAFSYGFFLLVYEAMNWTDKHPDQKNAIGLGICITFLLAIGLTIAKSLEPDEKTLSPAKSRVARPKKGVRR